MVGRDGLGGMRWRAVVRWNKGAEKSCNDCKWGEITSTLSLEEPLEFVVNL